MDELESLKAQIKKLNAQATNLKMNLHDLAEELPINWPQIMSVAQKAHDAFSELEQKRANLKALETA